MAVVLPGDIAPGNITVPEQDIQIVVFEILVSQVMAVSVDDRPMTDIVVQDLENVAHGYSSVIMERKLWR